MKRFILFVLLVFIPSVAYAQLTTASYGTVVTSLSTSSAGAVTGTTFAMPSTYSATVTWQVVADGSALSVNLEASNDNSTWATVDTQTTAAGGVKNYGFTASRFIRCSQVSRTGGTATTCTLVTSRAYNVNVSSSGNLTSSRFLAGDGTAAAPAFSFTSDPDTGFYSVAPNNVDFASNGIARLRLSTSGIALLRDDFSTITMGSSADTTLARSAAGKIQITGTTPMFQLGGTTASFPALKQNGATLQVRLADDSVLAPLTASTLSYTDLRNATAGAIVTSGTAPTISSGFGTSPSISANNGTASFVINVGTGGVATNGTITLPAVTTGWNCYVTDITAAVNHTGLRTYQIGGSTSSAQIESQNSAGAATAWATGSNIRASCFAY